MNTTITRLQNCAEILERNYDSLRGHWIVLAFNGGMMPYVVWAVDNAGHAYAGNYFYSFDGAMACYKARATGIQHKAFNQDDGERNAVSPGCVST